MKNTSAGDRQMDTLTVLRTKLNGIVNKSKIEPHTVRAFAELRSDNASAVFNYKAAAKVLKGETLLSDNHIFVGNLMAFGIAQVPVIGGVSAPGNMQTICYPHPDVFANSTVGTSSFSAAVSTGTSVSTELQSVRMFFNGLLTVKTDQDIRIENFAMSGFSILEQFGSHVPRGLHHVDMYNTMLLDGSKDNSATITYMDGRYDAIAGDLTTHRNYGISEIKGFIIRCDAATAIRVKTALGL